jgi:histidine triad (HIT) family protein
VSGCVFCEIVAGRAPATVVAEWPEAIAIVPLGPVVDGHVVVIPRVHVADAATNAAVTAITFGLAALHAHEQGQPFNLITSAGREATQSVFHLHAHYIPRSAGDRLLLPWGDNARHVV